MSETPRFGLVFSGGGGKGAYQIGVWKAFEEAGFASQIVGVAGSSVGAINAFLFAHGNLSKAIEIWENLSHNDILTFGGGYEKRVAAWAAKHGLGRLMTGPLVSGLMVFLSNFGFFSQEGLNRILDAYLSSTTKRELEIQVYTCAADVTGIPLNTLLCTISGLSDIKIGTPTYFTLNEKSAQDTREAILASAALPVVFEPVHIDGRTFYDGGLCDLMPLKALEHCSCTHVFVVHFNRDTFVPRESLPHAKVFEIVPQQDPGGLISGTLNFTGSHARQLIDAGYRDTMRILENALQMSMISQEAVDTLERTLQHEKAHKAERLRVNARLNTLLEEKPSRCPSKYRR